ncbi:methyltransferase domain-containing protein [Modestobacter sp. I12A-02628]|uniref:Methyltransferase domain-containing protein n=1 Tax=Goekera deserti TaxID=2497753 RepID=A0A7K3WAB9_9ACTN|nr:methyltransferase domain-containing protein [Goekera deserti]MPQ99262.1 methyltransferase domain-containing protein [Goekera deserti]NDI47597.1 methyltransferase domain-containing protein [Goekera deserti]NEL53408.1 methyltransferase domain-containing protein [Goekera deserti]
MTDPAALSALRSMLVRRAPLAALTGGAYAAAHLPYEQRSDQRALLADWLAQRLSVLADRPAGAPPLSVLSIGAGDGSVDVPLAARMAAGARGLRWVVVEPDPVVGAVCRDRLSGSVRPRPDVRLHAGPFETLADTVGEECFDVVLAVHSLYYVPDLAAALRAARRRLAPGGTLVTLLAPLEDLCRLTAAVTPPAAPPGASGPADSQWWSGDLTRALGPAGLTATVCRITGRLDVTDCFDPGSGDGRLVLDFLTQARCDGLTATERGVLLDALRSIATTEGGRLVVEHPVDAVLSTPSSAT